MTRIASAAGLSRAALYKHFQSKEAILMALNERVIEDARQVGLPLLRGPAPGGERLAEAFVPVDLRAKLWKLSCTI